VLHFIPGEIPERFDRGVVDGPIPGRPTRRAPRFFKRGSRAANKCLEDLGGGNILLSGRHLRVMNLNNKSALVGRSVHVRL
jgi:hypothetical protein